MPSYFYNSKRTIGFLSGFIDSEYERLLWTGFVNAAKELDVNTICFSEGGINSPTIFDCKRKNVYDLISEKNLDGLILVSSTTIGYLNQNETHRFLDKFKKLPLVTLGKYIKNIPSIISENEFGFRAILRHLIEEHGYRKFFYIGGYENSPDAIERLRVFKQTLEDYQIKIDPCMIVNGKFMMQLSYDLVCNMLDQKKHPDVIVSASDNMARGAMNAIVDRNLMVPDDIALTGYDDIYSAKLLLSPLTTIRQPLVEMGAKALFTLLDMIDGKKVPEIQVVKSEPVIRHSCGCLFHEVELVKKINAMSLKDDPVDDIKTTDLYKICFLIRKDMSDNYPAGFIKLNQKLIDNLIDLFVKAVSGIISYDDYTRMLDKSFRFGNNIYFEEMAWDGILTIMRKRISHYYNEDTVKIILINNYIDVSRIIISRIIKQVEMNMRLQIATRSRAIQNIFSRLLMSFGITNLLDTMSTELAKIGITSCYFSLHTSPEKIFSESRIIMAYNKNGRIDLGENGHIFPSDRIIPVDIVKIDERFDLITESLLYEEELLGFIVIEIKSIEGIQITAMINQIGSTIKASMLMNDAVQKGKELEKALTDLNENHEKLLISEKMASLGRLTAGIAHEMNTPLAAVRTSLYEINNLIQEYNNSKFDADVSEEDYNEMINDMSKSVNCAAKSIDKSLNFIKGIKSQTIEMEKKEKILFYAAEVINDSIFMMNYTLTMTNLQIEFRCSNDDITLFGWPGRLLQVMTNLIANAVDSMVGKTNGLIKINLSENNAPSLSSPPRVIITIEDQGCGIQDSIITRIYDPLFTTKPFGQATGLGLTTVHDIIYGEFDGEIEVESVVNSGTIFRLIINKPDILIGKRIQ